MNNSIFILNKTSLAVGKENIKHQLLIMLRFLVQEYKKNYQVINICFMNNDEIQKLNFEFNKKNKPTDTLSFIDNENPVSGDIAIAPFIIKKNAITDNIDFKYYFAEVLLHSLLHLFGMTHTYQENSLNTVYQLHQHIFKQLNINWSAFNVQFPK